MHPYARIHGEDVMEPHGYPLSISYICLRPKEIVGLAVSIAGVAMFFLL